MKQQYLTVLAMGTIVGGVASADVITVHTDRSAYNAAVGVPQIVEDFTSTFHFPLVSGVLNSLTRDAGLQPGDIEEGVTYSTPIGDGNFFNIDAGGGYVGGFLDGFNPSDRDVTIAFHRSDPNDLRTVNGFGFDLSGSLGATDIDVTISFSSGPDQNFNVTYLAGFYGFTSDARDITGVVISNNGSFFGFDFDNFTFDEIPVDCLAMTVDPLVAGQSATWNVSGATAGEQVAIVYGFGPGSTGVNGIAGYCATFGIQGVNQNKVICRKTADGNGDVSCRKSIPAGVKGRRVLTQAAERNTCPDECVSNLDDQVVG